MPKFPEQIEAVQEPKPGCTPSCAEDLHRWTRLLTVLGACKPWDAVWLFSSSNCIFQKESKWSPIYGEKSVQSASNSSGSILHAAERKQKFRHPTGVTFLPDTAFKTVPLGPLRMVRTKQHAGDERRSGNKPQCSLIKGNTNGRTPVWHKQFGGEIKSWRWEERDTSFSSVLLLSPCSAALLPGTDWPTASSQSGAVPKRSPQSQSARYCVDYFLKNFQNKTMQ